MPRPLSSRALDALHAPETAEVFLLLLTVDGAFPDAPLRFVNNMEDITSRGALYLACPFELVLPEDFADRLATVSLRVDNVDRRMVQAVRELGSPPAITLEVVLASAPDTLEAGPFAFTLRNVEYDPLVLTGALKFEDILNERFPQHAVTPATVPGAFRGSSAA